MFLKVVRKMRFLTFLSVIFIVKAQTQIELQFIGDSITKEEATERDLCRTKYCLLDANSLLVAATQNKSVRPCDDFKEFALGTFLRYRSVSDRDPYNGFFRDLENVYVERLRKVLAAPEYDTDTQVIRGMKDFFAKCVSSDFVNKNGEREIREYALSLGLSFFPQSNQAEFNLTNYIEQAPAEALPTLFFTELVVKDDPDPTKRPFLLKIKELEEMELRISSYADMLFDMNKIFQNLSYSEEFKKEFRDIANKQLDFYKLLDQEKKKSIIGENETRLMSIDELNRLTSSLNIDWLKVLNNQLITKVGADVLIEVERPQIIAKLAELLATTNKV